MFDKFVSWLTTAFDTFALAGAIAIGLKLWAPETSGHGFLQGAWTCIAIAAACWAVMVVVAAARERLAPAGKAEPLQLSDVRTAEREGHDGVFFCLQRPGGKQAFILTRSALAGLVDGDFPTRESMLLAFEIYRERIARTAAASGASGWPGPTLLTPSAFGAQGTRAVPAAVGGLRAPHFS